MGQLRGLIACLWSCVWVCALPFGRPIVQQLHHIATPRAAGCKKTLTRPALTPAWATACHASGGPCVRSMHTSSLHTHAPIQQQQLAACGVDGWIMRMSAHTPSHSAPAPRRARGDGGFQLRPRTFPHHLSSLLLCTHSSCWVRQETFSTCRQQCRCSSAVPPHSGRHRAAARRPWPPLRMAPLPPGGQSGAFI